MTKSDPTNESWRPYAIAFAATITAITVSSYLPHLRLWGLGTWAYLGTWAPLAAGIVSLAVVVLILRSRIGDQKINSSPAQFAIFTAAAMVAAGVVFALFRTETHFLGDGYSVLHLLAADSPLIKGREIGESMAHVWVKQLTGVTGDDGALWSFRIISITAGVLFTGATVLFARRRFDDCALRLVLIGGLLTGGYMLLFFGYVENYSLFVLAVGLFVLTGMAAAQGMIARWWILLPAMVAPIMHIIGLILLPATLYVLVAGTRTARQMSRLPKSLIWFGAALAAGGVLLALEMLRDSNPFVRFSLLRLFPDRFTVDGYTLFSPAHLLDMANLIVLLVPSAGIAAVAIARHGAARWWEDRGIRFLTVAAVSSIGAIFLFDPKLGMPRDWDLFSFAGLPLAALAVMTVLLLPVSRGVRVKIGVMVIVLGLLSLSGRVAVQNLPESGVAQFKSLMQLDFHRGVNARVALVDYYVSVGDTAASEAASEEWFRDFPAVKLLIDARDTKDAGRIQESVAMFRQVMELNPNAAGAWSNLGEIYVNMGLLDTAEAYLHTAVGLNPYEASAISNLGVIAIKRGDYPKARGLLMRARAILPGEPAISYNLAHTERLLGRVDKYEQYLTECTQLPGAPPIVFQDLGDLYLSRQDFRKAAEVFRRGLAKGLPMEAVQARIKQFPALRQELGR